MKIEPKELVGYLPYDLNFMAKGELYQMTEMQPHAIYEVWANVFFDEKRFEYIPKVNYRPSEMGRGFGINEIKPILRPPSDLTKEIEYKGERFVPIIELYRLSNEYYYRDELDYDFIDSWGAKGNILKVFHDRSKDEYTEFVFGNLSFRKDRTHSKGSFVFGMDLPHTIRVRKKIHNPYLLFQKLHEWHFDIHNWIDKGLAIDINTI